MHRDFQIKLGIYLVQPPYELDLHNFFKFQDLHYSIAERTLRLTWHRAQREGLPEGLPRSVIMEFRSVSEFRFRPRDASLPFTEDDCLEGFGYRTDEDWAPDDIMICDDPGAGNEHWLMALAFMSGAMIIVQADSAHATVVA